MARGGGGDHKTLFLTLAVSTIVVSFTVHFIQSGLLHVPLPYPAVNLSIIDSPPEDSAGVPVPWEGAFAPNELLHGATKLFDGQIQGSETVIVSPDGGLVLCDKFGSVWTVPPPADSSAAAASGPSGYHLPATPSVRLGNGRPLGSALDKEGNHIVCDALKGLLKVEKGTQRLSLLAAVVSEDSPLEAGSNIRLANDVAIHSDGRIFFSASQDILPALHPHGYWDTFNSYMLGLFSGHKMGKLLVHTPATGSTHVLANGFYFSNGVTLSADESFVLVVETQRSRVWRFWLEGPKAGTKEIFIDSLPGVPDGISLAPDGGFWLPLVVPNRPYMALLRFKVLRAILAWLPAPMRPPTEHFGCVLKVTSDGVPERTLQDTDGSHIAFVSSVEEHNGRLWMGNVNLDYISFIDL